MFAIKASVSVLEHCNVRARSSASRRAPWSLHRVGTAPQMSAAMPPPSITVTTRTRVKGQKELKQATPSID